MLKVSSPTHAAAAAIGPPCTLQAPPPAVVASTLGDLSLEDQRFAAEHSLPFCDMLSLLNAPSLSAHVDERLLVVLVMQLDAALYEQEWRMAEMVLCMLIRTDLHKVYDAACECSLGYVAQSAAQKNGERAASTARFGGLLFCKLVNLCASRDPRLPA
jgi:hypothetical protein